ncbi:hypothetical protein L210DRAFT_3176998 [Boletus edulis BED1]|uniref:Uncharacterized protein n=1 Tax=Boletus edulis BED1 TaxID=1328754 RepID=A0AAD4BGD6_BOLED|nr:hypothetical protein L210DRAFT_3176998 [Boletus edulis BED1]
MAADDGVGEQHPYVLMYQRRHASLRSSLPSTNTSPKTTATSPGAKPTGNDSFTFSKAQCEQNSYDRLSCGPFAEWSRSCPKR